MLDQQCRSTPVKNMLHVNHSLLISVIAILFQVGYVCAQDNATTTVEPALFAFSNQEKDGFPAWMIGVIVLSALIVIIAVVTIVQKMLRRRANNMEQYRMANKAALLVHACLQSSENKDTSLPMDNLSITQHILQR